MYVEYIYIYIYIYITHINAHIRRTMTLNIFKTRETISIVTKGLLEMVTFLDTKNIFS